MRVKALWAWIWLVHNTPRGVAPKRCTSRRSKNPAGPSHLIRLPPWSHAAHPSTSAQTTLDLGVRYALSSVSLAVNVRAASCISYRPSGPFLDPAVASAHTALNGSNAHNTEASPLQSG